MQPLHTPLASIHALLPGRDTRGPRRAAGLLAKAGIQNLVADKGVTARLVAENGEKAVQRVRAALVGQPASL
jgi:hypothetical protein